jgi:hypothetical protein
VPVVIVLGVGAVLEPMPPVAVEYHFNELPVAVSADAVAPRQYAIGETTDGAVGSGFTTTEIPTLGPSQPSDEV